LIRAGACQLQHRIPQASHVLQISHPLLRVQRIQCWHHRIGKQERVAAQELPLSEQSPSRIQPGDDPRLTAFRAAATILWMAVCGSMLISFFMARRRYQ